MDYPQVEFYADTAGEFRWRLRVRNGNILCDSAEGYSSKSACEAGFERTCRYMQGEIEEVREQSWKDSKSKAPKWGEKR